MKLMKQIPLILSEYWNPVEILVHSTSQHSDSLCSDRKVVGKEAELRLRAQRGTLYPTWTLNFGVGVPLASAPWPHPWCRRRAVRARAHSCGGGRGPLRAGGGAVQEQTHAPGEVALPGSQVPSRRFHLRPHLGARPERGCGSGERCWLTQWGGQVDGWVGRSGSLKKRQKKRKRPQKKDHPIESHPNERAP